MKKVTLYISTGFVGADYEEVIEVPDDITESELQKMAEDYLYDNIDFGYYEGGEDEDVED